MVSLVPDRPVGLPGHRRLGSGHQLHQRHPAAWEGVCGSKDDGLGGHLGRICAALPAHISHARTPLEVARSGVAILVANIFVFVLIDSLLKFAFWSLPKAILGAALWDRKLLMG